MIGRTTFMTNELPYEKLAKLGITRQSFKTMPKEIIDPLLKGGITPLIKANIKTSHGKTVHLPLRLQMVRDNDGNIKVMTFPVRKEIASDVKLSTREVERLKRGEVIKKDVTEDGTRKLKFFQLDKETNSVMKRSITSVKVQEKLRELEKVNDIELGQNQKQAAIEGKPMELNVGNQKVSVGVDLKEPQGFKVVQGDMMEWDKQQKIKYDLEHEGFMGYVQTDQNRWEYQQVLDKLSNKEQVHITQRQEEKQDKKQEQKQSSGMKLK